MSTLVKRYFIRFINVHPSETQPWDMSAMQKDKQVLQAEIEFVRFMIESRKGTVSEPVTGRMLNACALAERKLMNHQYSSPLVETR